MKLCDSNKSFLDQINQKHDASYLDNLKVLFFEEMNVQDVAAGNQSIHSTQ